MKKKDFYQYYLTGRCPYGESNPNKTLKFGLQQINETLVCYQIFVFHFSADTAVSTVSWNHTFHSKRNTVFVMNDNLNYQQNLPTKLARTGTT